MKSGGARHTGASWSVVELRSTIRSRRGRHDLSRCRSAGIESIFSGELKSQAEPTRRVTRVTRFAGHLASEFNRPCRTQAANHLLGNNRAPVSAIGLIERYLRLGGRAAIRKAECAPGNSEMQPSYRSQESEP